MEKMRQWALLTALAIAVILIAGYMLLVKPKGEEAAELRASAQVQRDANVALEAEIRRLNEQAKDLPRQQARLAAFAQRIPANPALPALIRSLTAAADTAGVSLLSLTPSLPVAIVAAPAAGAPGATAQTAATPVAAQTLYAVPIQVQVSGGFVQLQQYFSNLEDLSRSFQVSAFQLRPIVAEGGGAATGAVTAGISGRVFMTVDPVPAPAPVTAATPAPAGATAPGATAPGGAASPSSSPSATPAQ